MKQKEAVINFWKQGSEQGLTGKDLVEFVSNEVFHGLMAGDIDHGSATIKTDEKEARSYAKAVTHNYFKKAKELNGGIKYEPTSKRGPIVKDPELKDLKTALKALEANQADMGLISQVKDRISSKEAEIQASKAQSKLPSLDQAMETLAKLGINV